MATVRTFQFIGEGNNSDVKHSRKLIRSHVMKGKNMGRKLGPRGLKGAARHSLSCSPQPASTAADSPSKKTINAREVETETALTPRSHSRERRHDQICLGIFAGSEYSYVTFLTKFTPRMRELIYTCELVCFYDISPESNKKMLSQHLGRRHSLSQFPLSAVA